MSFIIAGADHRDRFIARFPGLRFRQTGAAGVKAFAQAHDAGAQTAAVRRFRSSHRAG